MEKIIAVICAGTMGSGIAHTATAAGYQVILQDIGKLTVCNRYIIHGDL